MADQQTCRSCGETKPLTDYYRHQSTKNRRQQHCKQCTKSMCLTSRATKQLEKTYQRLHKYEDKLRELTA